LSTLSSLVFFFFDCDLSDDEIHDSENILAILLLLTARSFIALVLERYQVSDMSEVEKVIAFTLQSTTPSQRFSIGMQLRFLHANSSELQDSKTASVNPVRQKQRKISLNIFFFALSTLSTKTKRGEQIDTESRTDVAIITENCAHRYHAEKLFCLQNVSKAR
jgi:hypothetical protein